MSISKKFLPTSEDTVFVSIFVRGNAFHGKRNNVRDIRINQKTVIVGNFRGNCEPTRSCGVDYDACILSYELSGIQSLSFDTIVVDLYLDVSADPYAAQGCGGDGTKSYVDVMVAVDMHPSPVQDIPQARSLLTFIDHLETTMWESLNISLQSGLNLTTQSLSISFPDPYLITGFVMDGSFFTGVVFSVQYQLFNSREWVWYRGGMENNGALSYEEGSFVSSASTEFRVFTRFPCQSISRCGLVRGLNGTLVPPEGCIEGNITVLRSCGGTTSSLSKFRFVSPLVLSVLFVEAAHAFDFAFFTLCFQ